MSGEKPGEIGRAHRAAMEAAARKERLDAIHAWEPNTGSVWLDEVVRERETDRELGFRPPIGNPGGLSGRLSRGYRHWRYKR